MAAQQTASMSWLHLLLWLNVFLSLASVPQAFAPLPITVACSRQGADGRYLQATSSRDLKEERRRRRSKKKHPAVKRLARAAANAAALYPPTDDPTFSSTTTNSLASLQELTKAIDKQLQDNQRSSALGLVQHASDSMISLLGYNENHAAMSSSNYNVAVVFGKSLVDDQVTAEYASRIQTLVKLIVEKEVSLFCFCGGKSGDNHIADADAGYVCFRHLCASQQVDVSHVDIYIDRKCNNVKGCLKNVAHYLRQHHVPQWLDESANEESSTDEYGMERERLRKKIHVHFLLVSTGYHLCNLNDVHHRSPGQSLLKPIQDGLMSDSNLAREDDYWEDDDDDGFAERIHARMERSQQDGIVETSWSFRYAPYPYLYVKDDEVAFRAKCFLLGQELQPLLTNLKGVVQEKEFFQRDNYLVLASIRRSLVTQVEELYQKKPSLQTDINIVMEGAVLSLGRCIDLVRPAGLLVGSVSRSDYVKALKALQHATKHIRECCDPDVPLNPSEWGKLNEEEESGEVYERLYMQLNKTDIVVDEETSDEEPVEYE